MKTHLLSGNALFQCRQMFLNRKTRNAPKYFFCGIPCFEISSKQAEICRFLLLFDIFPVCAKIIGIVPKKQNRHFDFKRKKRTPSSRSEIRNREKIAVARDRNSDNESATENNRFASSRHSCGNEPASVRAVAAFLRETSLQANEIRADQPIFSLNRSPPNR